MSFRSAYDDLRSIFSWALLPDLFAQLLHAVVRRVRYRTQAAQRSRTAGAYQRERSLCRIVAIVGILLYFAVNAILTRDKTYYDVLGVPVTASGADLRTQFKAIAYASHPDKLIGLAPEDVARIDQHYRDAKTAYDVLRSTEKRAIYDRLGSEIANCNSCILESDFVFYAMIFVGFNYASYLFLNFVISFFQSGKLGSYWRIVGCLLLFSIDASVIVGASSDTMERLTLGYFPPYVTVGLIRCLGLNLMVALADLQAAVMELIGFPTDGKMFDGLGGELTTEARRQLLQEAVAYAEFIKASAKASMRTFIEPFIGTPDLLPSDTSDDGNRTGTGVGRDSGELLKHLQFVAEKLAVDNTLMRTSPEFESIVESQRRRQWNILRSVNSNLGNGRSSTSRSPVDLSPSHQGIPEAKSSIARYGDGEVGARKRHQQDTSHTPRLTRK